MTVDFLVIGDTQLDTILVLDPAEAQESCHLDSRTCRLQLDYAGKIPVAEAHTLLAGNGANAAVAAARLGLDTVFWTLLGDDETAKRQLADRSWLSHWPNSPNCVSATPRSKSRLMAGSTVLQLGQSFPTSSTTLLSEAL